jgi:hypothetical protein
MLVTIFFINRLILQYLKYTTTKIYLETLYQLNDILCAPPVAYHYDCNIFRKKKMSEAELLDYTHRMNQALCELEVLHSKVYQPQIIKFAGLEDLHLNCKVDEYKDKIDTLFFSANIPLYWILDIDIKISPDDKVFCHVTMLNYFVKEKTLEKLQYYFENQYLK